MQRRNKTEMKKIEGNSKSSSLKTNQQNMENLITFRKLLSTSIILKLISNQVSDVGLFFDSKYQLSLADRFARRIENDLYL